VNLELNALRRQAGPADTVYFYVIQSIVNRGGHFIQTGCGPNFEGGLITLCTCKHRMRTFMDREDWTGKWIAGFTNMATGHGANFLVYLMRVSHAFESHSDLWLSSNIPTTAKQAKAAHANRFGDIYKPRSTLTDPYDPRDYTPPHNDHVHAGRWQRDIAYVGCSGRYASLLVGDPDRSYLWNRPMLIYPFRLSRGQKKCGLDNLLAQLEQGSLS
jgi:hypothetical protein